MPKQDAAGRLATYMKKRGISLRTAGDALVVTHITVLDWLRRRKVPSEKTDVRERIEKWTGGYVAAASWPKADERKAA